MHKSWTLGLLKHALIITTLLTSCSNGFSQSLSYVKCVALQKSYYAPILPYNVLAVYGDFQNRSPLWVQLWREVDAPNAWELHWQERVVPSVGDGAGEWINITSQVTMVADLRLGIVNDALPGPMQQTSDVSAEIILSEVDVTGQGTGELNIQPGEQLIYDDLVFPYLMPLYLCNTSDCIYVRHRLGRAELPVDNTQSTTRTTEPPLVLTNLPIRVVEEDMTPLAVWMWLVGLSLLLLLILLSLTCVCALIQKRKKRQENAYSQVTPASSIQVVSDRGLNRESLSNCSTFSTSSSSTGLINHGYAPSTSTRSSEATSAKTNGNIDKLTSATFDRDVNLNRKGGHGKSSRNGNSYAQDSLRTQSSETSAHAYARRSGMSQTTVITY